MNTQRPESNSSEPRVFIDPDTRFSIQIPNGWQVDTSGQQGSKLILYHPHVEENFCANINVLAHDLAPLTRDEYITFTRLQLKQLTGFAQLPVDAAATDRDNGHIFEWMIDQPPYPVRFRQLIAFDQSRAFAISATAPLDRFENRRFSAGGPDAFPQ